MQGSTYSLEVSDRDYFYGSVGASAISESVAPVQGTDVLNKLGSLVNNLRSISFSDASAGGVSAIYGSGMQIGDGSAGLGYSGL